MYSVLNTAPLLAAVDSTTDYESVITTISSTLSNANLVAVLGHAAGLAVILVFTYWAVRKCTRVLMGAFKKGRLRL